LARIAPGRNTLGIDGTLAERSMTERARWTSAQRFHNDLPAMAVATAGILVDGTAILMHRLAFSGIATLAVISVAAVAVALRPRELMSQVGAQISTADMAFPAIGLAVAVIVDIAVLMIAQPTTAGDAEVLGGALGFTLILTSRLLCAQADNRALSRTLSSSAEALGETEDRFRELIINSSDIITVIDETSVVKYITPAVTRLLGITEAEIIGNQLIDFLHPEDRERFNRRLAESALHRSKSSFQFRIRDRHLSWRTLEATPTNLLTHPSIRGIVLNTRDITERQALENELRHQAFHDPLTNLANRSLLHDRLEQSLKRHHRHGDPLALILVDIDDFKTINDSLGHAEGDELLRQASARMLKCLRASDTAARLGGDEFAILLEGQSEDLPTLEIAHRLMRGLEQPIMLGETAVVVRASLGVALADGRVTADDLLRRADVAMYRAKSLGKARCVVFDDSMEQYAHDRLQFQNELEGALHRNEFMLHYQPVIDLETGIIDGVEALVRWNHPTRGLLQPDDFIPAIEKSALIIPVSRFILKHACSQAKRWEGLFPKLNLEVGVNISAIHLQSPNFVDDILRAVRNSHIQPETLILELTETAVLADIEDSVAKLERIKQLGVRVALDDFGTGYSSLGYLRELPIDVVKIDRSFLVHIVERPEHTELVRAIQALSASLDLRTTAEGVETRAQLAVLRALHVDHAQGFLFSHPVDAVETERLLAGDAFDVQNTEGIARIAATPA
jgi:diguanylate cyclase (GGDEF)-like protein/PAS domain S-box-containing protein